jgi:flagellar hook assembly protein FlgD
LNITDSLTAFGDIYLIPGSGDFLTDYSNIEIINEGIKLQSYPNPFNLETTISFSIPEESEVNITVYNVKGQKIKILESNIKSTGTHSIVWNGKDVNGNQVGSGVYLFRLNVNGKTQKVKKCLLLK